MNKRTIKIPEGIYYLTSYPDLSYQLTDKYYILNKVMTGCGATTFFLSDNIPTVLCVPRRELAFCKANSNLFKDKVHLFSSQSYLTSKDTGTVLDKINEMKDYLWQCRCRMTPKIIVTYDSTKHVILPESFFIISLKFSDKSSVGIIPSDSYTICFFS